MAKAKKDAVAEGAAVKKLREMFGEGVVMMGDRLVDQEPEIVSIAPAIDNALGGGLLVGTLMTMAGLSGCGKTNTALRMAERWQKRGKKVFWIAVEPRIFKRDLTTIRGLDPSKITFIRSVKGRILTGQEMVIAIETIMYEETDALIIVDSISMLINKEEMEKQGSEGLAPATISRTLSNLAKKANQALPVNRNNLVCIAHVYANIGGKKAWKAAVPSKLEYLRSAGLLCTYFESEVDKKTGAKVGQKIEWVVDRTLLGGAGKVKFSSHLTFGKGIDVSKELAFLGIDLGFISVSGSWYKLSYLGEDAPNLQGIDAVATHLDEHPERYEVLNEKVRGIYS